MLDDAGHSVEQGECIAARNSRLWRSKRWALAKRDAITPARERSQCLLRTGEAAVRAPEALEGNARLKKTSPERLPPRWTTPQN